jgi:hypothetical protein
MKKKLDICIYLCDNMRILNKKLKHENYIY